MSNRKKERDLEQFGLLVQILWGPIILIIFLKLFLNGPL